MGDAKRGLTAADVHAIIDEREKKHDVELIDEFGIALGMFLPLLFECPPSSPEATKETLADGGRIDAFIGEVKAAAETPDAMGMPRIPSRRIEAYIEALVLGLLRHRDGRGVPTGE